MAGSFAYAALLAWPLVAVVLFRTLSRTDALIWTVLGGYLALPVATEVDVAVLPAFDKMTVPALAAFAILALSERHQPRDGWLPDTMLARGLLAMFLCVPLITALLNATPVESGARTLRGMTPYDGASLALEHLMLILPMLLGRRYLSGTKAHGRLLLALMLSGLVYALPILIELRLSPQLHKWVYGFFPHSFAQQLRAGGYRPVVFLGHGLLVAMFVATAMVAATAMWRSASTQQTQWAAVVGVLAILLVLCKSLGALLLGALGVLLVGIGGRWIVRIAVLGIAGLTLSYPVLRAADALPFAAAVEMVEQVRPDRAQSLQFRLDNEEILMARAAERPAFGWGGWSRNRVFDARGYDVSTTDGRWIITLGSFGWIGFAAEFGLLVLGVLLLAGPLGGRLPFATGALCIVLCINLLDLIPNASLTPVTWLIAGALLGTAEARLRVGARRQDQASGLPPEASARGAR